MGKGGGSKKAKPTRHEKELTRQSAIDMNHYMEWYRPAEMQFLRDVMSTAGDRESARGQAAGEIETARAGLDLRTVAAEALSGADSDSGRSKFSRASGSDTVGEARGVSVAQTEQSVDDQDLAMGVKFSKFGRKLADDSRQNLSNLAQTSTSVAIAKAEAKNRENMAKIEAAGAIVGAAVFKEGGLADKIKARRDKITLPARSAETKMSPRLTPSPSDALFNEY